MTASRASKSSLIRFRSASDQESFITVAERLGGKVIEFKIVTKATASGC